MNAALAGVLMALVAANLVPDGGFEEGKWELASWDRGQGRHEYVAGGRGGGRCVHLVGISEATGRINELAISPPVKVAGGGSYLFAVWYRSAGEAGPFLSMASFDRPFSETGWAKGRVQYLHKYLPASQRWRLALWRFEVSAKAVEMRLMVRLAGVGEAWFDDASLTKVGSARMYPTAMGDFAALPDGRIYEAQVDVADKKPWRVALVGEDGSEVGAAEGVGPNRAARVRFSAAAGARIRALLEVDGAVVDFAEFTAPPLLELALDKPRYRNALYASRRLKEVEARLEAHAAPEVYRRISYAATVVPEEACPAARQWRPMRQAVERIRLAAGDLSPGRWRLLVETRGAPGYEELEVPLKVLPPGRPHEVIIDEHNRLVVDGKPIFPRGFYGPPDNDDKTRPIAEAGYNTILSYGTDPEFCKRWLDMCQRLGLWGMVHLARPFVANFDEQKLRAAIRKVKNHPALLAYYLFDEPNPARPGQRPEDLRRVYDVLADEDPYHPVAVCINVPANERLYIDCYDIVMIDVYPVRSVRQPLEVIGERMDHAWESTQGRKPVWFIPQAFGYDVVEGLEGPPRWVTPTPEEERAMHYLALAHGARGMIAYCYHVYTRYDAQAKKKGKWPWRLGGYLPTVQKKLWGALVELGKEYRQLERALTQPRVAWHRFGNIHVAWFGGDDGELWMVAVNGQRDRADEQWVPAVPPQVSARPVEATELLSGRRVELKGERVRLRLGPMETTSLRVGLRRR